MKKTLTCKSGFRWDLVGEVNPITAVSTVTVILPAGSPVLSYTQAGQDRASRKLAQVFSTESRVVARARADFGV